MLGATTRRFYLVFVKALAVLRSGGALSFTPFVKVLREEAFQLEAADVVQLVFAGRHAPECNAGTRKNKRARPLDACRHTRALGV